MSRYDLVFEPIVRVDGQCGRQRWPPKRKVVIQSKRLYPKLIHPSSSLATVKHARDFVHVVIWLRLCFEWCKPSK